MEVELDYWTARKQVEIELARCAKSHEARLVHLEMARRYGAQIAVAVAAAQVRLVVGQIPPGYVVNDPRQPIIADSIPVAPLGAAS